MLVLGIDPGTAITGYGLVEEVRGRLAAVAYGAVTTPAGANPESRLLTIFEELSGLIVRYAPAAVAVEELFFNKNVRTALAVGQARGVCLLSAANSGVPVAEYTPLQVKQAVTGTGKAAKEQVGYMVRALLGLPSVPRPDDVADALAVAICHVHSAPAARLLSGYAEGGRMVAGSVARGRAAAKEGGGR